VVSSTAGLTLEAGGAHEMVAFAHEYEVPVLRINESLGQQHDLPAS
jgi:hypothetical protein